jgi:hypothetical protein
MGFFQQDMMPESQREHLDRQHDYRESARYTHESDSSDHRVSYAPTQPKEQPKESKYKCCFKDCNSGLEVKEDLEAFIEKVGVLYQYCNYHAKILKQRNVNLCTLEQLQRNKALELEAAEATRLADFFADKTITPDGRCSRCNDTGIWDTGNNEVPCTCPKGQKHRHR